MDPKYNLFWAAVVTVLLFEQGQSLTCYECNSLLDPKCGKTWEMTPEEARNYSKTCEGEVAACRKIDSTDTIYDKQVVIRSCWSTGSVEDLVEEFLDCEDLGPSGNACYCVNGADDKPCNTGSPLRITATSIVTLSSAIFIMFILLL